METDQKKDTIKVLDKALIILDTLRNSDKPMGVNEISKKCKINVTTTFRILKTMKSHGWVYQDENDKYIIGYKIAIVTEKNNFYLALKEMAYFTMVGLTNVEAQVMNLCVREYNKILILEQSRTEKLVDYVPPRGSTLPIYASASGKVLLSEVSQPLLDEIIKTIEFKQLARNTITGKKSFLDELKEVRQKGYALDINESDEIGSCIAVPMRDKDGEIIASLTFSGFIGGIPKNDIEYYFEVLKKASKEIMEKLYNNK